MIDDDEYTPYGETVSDVRQLQHSVSKLELLVAQLSAKIAKLAKLEPAKPRAKPRKMKTTRARKS